MSAGSDFWMAANMLRPGSTEAPASSGAPRVLLEGADGAILWAGQRVLEREGFEVRTCLGPKGLHKGRCPLVSRGHCGLAEGADVIVTQMRPNQSDERDVLEALADADLSARVIVEAGTSVIAEEAELLGSFAVLPEPALGSSLVRAVREALA